MSGFSFGGVYAENIFFIFIFFQYVLVLFDGCMIVYLLLSHVFGSVTGFVYMWKLSWALPLPSYWHLRLHFQHKHTNPYTQKGMQFQLLSHFPSLFVLLITRSLNVLKWLGKSWFLVLGMYSSGHKSFLAEKI